MNSKKITIFISLLLIAIPSFSNTQADDNNPLKMIEKFFALLDSAGNDAAVDYIFSSNENFTNEEVDIANIRAVLNKYSKLLGEYHDYEILESKKVGKYYITISTLARFDRQPMRFLFSFYKVKGVWKTFKFSFDDNIFNEINESIKPK
jgi:ABC-type transporter MlaC component